MNLYVLSDLHAEFVDFTPDRAALEAADVVVLAGDIHDGETATDWIRSKFGDKPIIWVAGNHEFYGHHWERCVWDMQRISEHYGIHFLEDQAVTLGGVDFLGCTLWTDFELLGTSMKDESIRWSQKILPDYR